MLGEDAEGDPDYTTLFDLEYIDKTMNELFPEEEESSEPDESSVPEAGKPDDKGGNPNRRSCRLCSDSCNCGSRYSCQEKIVRNFKCETL